MHFNNVYTVTRLANNEDINVFTIVTRLCGWWHPAADDGGVICCNPFVPTKLLDFTVPSCSFHWV